MDMPEALKEIGEIGQAFANDLDDALFGKFGFTVREDKTTGNTELVATFSPLLPKELADEEGQEYGPAQEFLWRLVPVSGHAG